MNVRLVFNVVGRILKIEGALMLVPMLVAVFYQEPMLHVISFLIPATITYILGFIFSYKSDDYRNLYTIEGFMIVGISWILLSLMGSFPYMMSGVLPHFGDAFFETASGFTTTGATVIDSVGPDTRSILFWRAFSQWIGGMGVLVFAFAVLPKSRSQTQFIMQAEAPGTQLEKLQSRVSSSARLLLVFYIVLTLIVAVLLIFGGFSFFDSLLIAFGVSATGGFSQYKDPIARILVSPYVEVVITLGMFIFGANFNLFYLAIKGQFREIWKNEELRWYVGIVLGAAILITLNLTANGYNFTSSLRHGFFNSTSMVTTTAYLTEDFTVWPVFSRTLLNILMFTGAMSGSTAGGLKISRLAILFKNAMAGVKQLTYPNRIVTVHFNGRVIDNSALKEIVNYFFIYIVVFVIGMFIVNLEVDDFLTAFSTSASMLNNIGVGFELVGPSYNYAFFSQPMKIFLSLLMIMGRLEIYPILILFSGTLWRRRHI